VSGLLMLRSLSRGFIQSPIVTITMATLPDHQVRLGAGLRGLLNSLGATFRVAVAGIMMQNCLTLYATPLGENQPTASFMAYHDMFFIMAVLVLLTPLPALRLRQRRSE
jgi:hypothetical protein